jgi:hypothetical protein
VGCLPYVLAVAHLLAGAVASGASLSGTTPTDSPGAKVLGGWRKVAGDVETSTTRISYELYVNPEHEAMYEVTRYRVTRLSKGSDGRIRARTETEKFLWNAHPGREHLRCFELLADGTWVRLKSDTPEYRGEMANAIYVYGLHRKALGLADP